MVPYEVWNQSYNTEKISIHLFTLSQTLGIFLCSSCVMLVYYFAHLKQSLAMTEDSNGLNLNLEVTNTTTTQWTRFKRLFPPLWAGLVPGMIWALGFYFSLEGVKVLGMGV